MEAKPPSEEIRQTFRRYLGIAKEYFFRLLEKIF